MGGRPPLGRREFLKAGGVGAAALGSGLLAGPASAKGKKSGEQVPGIYRFSLGTFEVTIISDGNLVIPAAFMAANVPDAERNAFLKSYYLDTGQHISHLNLCLINTGKQLVMIDTGAGTEFQPSAGRVVANLEAAGYTPDQIDQIIITHGHPDHIWGIIDTFEEAPRFPHAEYTIHKAEWDFWMSENAADRLAEGFKGFAIGAKKNLLPVSARTKRAEGDGEVVAGVRILETFGHTPGHISVLAESEGEKLLVTGDTITDAYISLEHPEWHPKTDMQPDVAEATRKRLLEMAASEGMLVSSYHIPFPGVGRVARRGRSYRWVPMVWEWEL